MMKRLFLTLACALAVLTAPAAGGQCGAMSLLGAGCANSAPPSALLTNLISYWALDEASGNALDSKGTNPLAETSGTIDSGTAVAANTISSRDFESVDTEYFNIADNVDVSVGDIDFTFTAWVNAESLGADRDVVGKDSGSAPSREYLFGFQNSTTRFRFTVFDAATGGTATTVLANVLGAPSTATAYFVVVWHDAAGDTINIQVNNGTANSAAFAGGVRDATSPFQVGTRLSAATYWDGLIDEVGFWKRILTAGEKTWLYNSGAGRSYADVVACVGC